MFKIQRHIYFYNEVNFVEKSTRNVKIALLVNVLPLIDEKFFGGGGVLVEKELAKELVSAWDNIHLIPKLTNVYYILENKNVLRNLINSKVKDRILGLECLNSGDSLVIYLSCIVQELRNNNYFLVDLNYSPGRDYQGLIRRDESIRTMPLFDRLSLRLGEIIYLTRKTRTKGAALLQGEGLTKIRFGIPITYLKNEFYKLTNKSPVNVFLSLRSAIWYTKYKSILEQLLVTLLALNPYIVRIYGVSEGQLVNLGIQYFKKTKAIFPPFGIRKSFLQYDTRVIKKENYGIFWARHVPLKGTLEIPYIVKEIVKEKKDFVLRMAGKFAGDIDKRFFDETKKLGIERNIEYIGFLDEKDLAEYIRRAKVFIYPTHEDSFGIVILESIYFRTPVVTYDILGPKSVFKDVPIVKFVKEYDYKKMAKEALKILNMSDEEYYSFISDRRVDEFIGKFKDWKSIASQYYNDIMSLANKKIKG